MALFRTRRSRAPAAWAVLSLTILVSLAIALPATGAAAAPVTWLARVGAAGANGQAAITGPATAGTAGSLKLSLKGLSASATYPVKVQKGTCAAPGSVLFTAPSQKSSSAGKISKVVPIPAAKMDAIRAATSLVLRVGSGSKLRCGPFTGGPPPTPTATIGASTAIDGGLGGIATDGDAVWAVGDALAKAYRFDLATAKASVVVDFTADLGPPMLLADGQPLVLGGNGMPALGFGALWIPSLDTNDPWAWFGRAVFLRLDTGTRSVVGRVLFAGRAVAAAVGDGAVWALESGPDALHRIDPATMTSTRDVMIPADPRALAVGPGAVWVAAGSSLYRVDTATSAVASIGLGAEATGVAVSEGVVWAVLARTGSGPAKLVRVVPETLTVASSVDVPGSPAGVAVGGGYVWVAPGDKEAPIAVAVSATSMQVLARLTLPAALGSVVIRGRTAWFAGWAPADVPDLVRVDY